MQMFGEYLLFGHKETVDDFLHFRLYRGCVGSSLFDLNAHGVICGQRRQQELFGPHAARSSIVTR